MAMAYWLERRDGTGVVERFYQRRHVKRHVEQYINREEWRQWKVSEVHMTPWNQASKAWPLKDWMRQ